MRARMAAWLLVIPVVASSQELSLPPPSDPTAHRHLGFYFHASAGYGFFQSRNETGSVSGGNIPVALAVGGAVVENFIIAPELWGGAVLGPNYPYESVVTVALGLNLTYYFMPVNVYVSATPSFVGVGGDGPACVDGPNGPSGPALPPHNPQAKCDALYPLPFYSLRIGTFGMRTALGKEWWISTHWGLGLALEFSFTLPGKVYFGTLQPSKASALAGALTLSMTYN